MIKQLIGILVAVAVIVVIVVAALHHDKYTSMISSGSSDSATQTIEAAPLVPAVEIPVEEAPADSVALHAADSVAQ